MAKLTPLEWFMIIASAIVIIAGGVLMAVGFAHIKPEKRLDITLIYILLFFHGIRGTLSAL
ncbi:hypothetical protein HS7_04050 [Sulfolobales archaeon HS-7]|nr:hypothetical protein HS7_04050 [Sulfolobales archaeon HS-7]